MTSETKSAAEIEREIERERAGLQDNLEDLQERFSFDGVVQQVGDQLREHGGEFSRSVATAARDNPVALALTGIGVAWLIFGSGRKRSGARYGYSVEDRYGYRDDDRYEDRDSDRYGNRDYMRRPASGRNVAGTPPRTAVGVAAQDPSRHRAASAHPTWARDWDRGELESTSSSTESGSSWSDKASDAAGTVKDKASGAADAVRGTAAGARDTVQSRAADVRDASRSTAQSVRDTATGAWSSASERAEALSRRVREGTENLSEEARERIAAARLRALEARDEASRRLSQGADQAAEFYEEHPMVVGALAFAVGAAIAGALPRTRLEDEYVGEYSDNLIHEAERVYEEELEKAKKAVKAGVDEAKNVASEMKSEADSAAPGDKSAVQAAEDKAKSAASRVADAAKSKAEDENLGKVDKKS